MNGKRIASVAAGAVAFAIVVAALALLGLRNFDWNRAKPWINERASQALGRPFIIDGDLSLTWDDKSPTKPNQDNGWRGMIPWPHLVAHDVRIGNPAYLTVAPPTTGSMPAPLAGDMARVSQFNFSLNPLALLEKRIVIPLLRFDTPVVTLLRSADGKNNWTFNAEDSASPWRLELQSVVFAKGSVHLIDAVKHVDVTVAIDTLAADPTYGVAWQLRGTLNGEAISGAGKAGAVLSLQHEMAPYPVEGTLHIGQTIISAVGTVTKPTDLAAIDARLKLSGVSMGRLYLISHILLPETPPYSTEGHLIGTLGPHQSHWIYEDFKGKVGGSDIGGALDYQTKTIRPLLSGTVVSHLMQFADLAPLIGADSNSSKAKRGAATVQPADKALPIEPFKTDRWTSIDTDVKFSADKIIWKNALPINKLTTNLHLRDGVLSLLPLDFDIANGNVSADITLDGSGRSGVNAIKAEMKVSARSIKVQQLFPAIQGLQASIGEVNGDASLSAVGNSVASLLGASNGEIKALMRQGMVSKLLLEEMGLNVGNIIVTKLIGDKQVKLECLAADFGVRNGLMQTRSFIVDTDAALINVDGTIDLKQEQMDFTVRPKSKGLRVFSLRAPIYVRGSFLQPRVTVDKGVMAMKAAGAVALTLLTPLAAMIPLTNAGQGEHSDCVAQLAAAQVKPAPPPAGEIHRQKIKPKVK